MCEHTNTKLITTGSIYFYGGELIDTTRDEVICLDCGEEVETEADDIDLHDIIYF